MLLGVELVPWYIRRGDNQFIGVDNFIEPLAFEIDGNGPDPMALGLSSKIDYEGVDG